MRTVFIIIIALLIIYLPLRFLIHLISPNDISFSNLDGSFTATEYLKKGDDYELILRRFESFKMHVRNNDTDYLGKDTTVLNRLDPKRLWQVWNYGEFLFNKKYHLPYKNWEEIRIIRGPKTNNKYQTF